MHSTSTANEAHETKLIPLDEALAPYKGVSLRTGRQLIKSGKLPASKPGREYLVDPADVARVLAPTVRSAAPRKGRESESARIARQLSEAGVGR